MTIITNSTTNPRQIISMERLERIYASADWGIVTRNSRIKQHYNGFNCISLFKEILLPFLINIPSERALIYEIQERDSLQKICGFETLKIPTRGTIWNFRNSYRNDFSDVLIKLLISIAINEQETLFNLPYIYNYSIEENVLLENPLIIRINPLSVPIKIWKSKKAQNGHSNEHINIAHQIPLWEFDEQNREEDKRNINRSPYDNMGLPILIDAPTIDGNIKFTISKPSWLVTYQERRDTLTTQFGPATTSKPNTVCHVIVRKIQGEKEFILLSKKYEGLAKGKFILPGGKKRIGEDLLTCAKRELREETGLILQESKPVSINLNTIQGRPENYSVGIIAEKYKGIPRNIEDDINSQWEWFAIDNLPDPLFEPVEIVIGHYKSKKFPNLKYEDVESKIIIGLTDQLLLPGIKN